MPSIRLPSWSLVAAAAFALPLAATSLARAQSPAAAPPPAACGGATEAAPTARPDLALATFDSAWFRIRTQHFDTTFNGVDWDALREELRPRAEAARNIGELRGVLNDMLGRLEQSHFSIIPREASVPDTTVAASGEVGLTVRIIGGEAVVTEVVPESPAGRAGVQRGWVVASIGSCPVAELTGTLRKALEPRRARLRASRMVDQRLDGPEGSTVHVTLRDGDDRVREVPLVRAEPVGRVVRFGGLPPMRASLDSRRLEPAAGTSVGVIRFSAWFPVLAAQIDSAIDAHRDAGGIVLDLRGNPGGVGGMVMGLAGHFLSGRDTLGTMHMRGQSLHFVANPRQVTASGRRVEPLRAPLAILVDEASASTSEIFAGAMQTLGRARVFGDTTAGAALPAVMYRLPNEDVLYHAIADFTLPDGSRLEGRGVIPDVVTPLTRADLLAGRDPALDAALRWLAARPRTQ